MSFYFKNKAHPKLAKYLSTSLKHTTNLNINKIEKILESFDIGWTKKLRQERNYQDYKDTLQSIYDNRNKIAHGEISNIGLGSLETSYKKIKEFFLQLSKIIEC